MRKLTICGCDAAGYTIVLKPAPEAAEKTAAEFLQRVIDSACGVTLPISCTADTAEHGIFIGTREPSDEVKWDGFRITTDEGNLYLDGNIPRGTLYAAYDFAGKYIGYRRFAVDCEVIPTEGEEDVPCYLNIVDNPVFEVRRCSWADIEHRADLASFSRLNSNLHTDMNAHGGVVFDFMDCHTYQKYCSAAEYGESHPEYFALVNGVRENEPGHQLCLSNPDVLRIVTENVLAELRANPETSLLDFSQEDGTLGCTCEHCAAIDEEEGSQSGSMIRFVNALAEAVEKEFPDVMIQTFAYEYTTKPPKLTKARENVIIRYCTYDACFRHAIDDPSCGINRETTFREMKGWGEMCHHMSIWDYITNWDSYLAPYPNLVSLRENARFYAQCHAMHVYESDTGLHRTGGVYGELRAYLACKVMWNPYMSESEYDRHINEFLEGFYGPGWREIRRYIDLEHEVTANRCYTCKQDIDICFVHIETYPKLNAFKRFFRRNYEALPYQPVYPDHPLTGLCQRMDEAEAFFDRAYAAAETDVQRERIERSRFSLTYMKLFCTEHNEFSMTADEKAAYEAEVEEFYKKKKEYGFFYNLHTEWRGE
ncbi:MAG: DUF4838 domain-containing protein [Ruminococcaceae bacterium]|nr:DUF4838 domain-containing protein [Oscillospiraceae bacterium]